MPNSRAVERVVLGVLAAYVLAPAAARWLRALRSLRCARAFARVAVGTTNGCKLSAVTAVLCAYPEVAAADTVESHVVPSGVSEQPIGMEHTARGARNRAAAAHAAACAAGDKDVLGLGIESGLFVLDGAHFDVCVVSAFDGAAHHLGLSCAFEIPPPILSHVLDGGLDLSQACNAAGITADPRLGERGGLIGLLSSGRLDRQQYTEQAVTTALFFATERGSRWYKPLHGAQRGVATTAQTSAPSVQQSESQAGVSAMQRFINETRAKGASGRGKEPLDTVALQAARAADKRK